MSDYIIHNIGLTVSPQLDLFCPVEEDKPVHKYPNYYLGKIIGGVGNELDLYTKGTVPFVYFCGYSCNHVTFFSRSIN